MMTEFNPKVSIIIPVYNGANYLREAIDSALTQTYQNFEVIVINDGSNDEGSTDRIALSYGRKIRYFKKDNGGVGSALNYGIDKMEGDYFSWLSHDDLYDPRKIQTQIDLIRKANDKYIIPYSCIEYIDSKSLPLHRKEIIPIDYRKMKYALITNSPIHGCTLLIHKKVFETIGNFNQDLVTAQDYDLWFRIAEKFQFLYMPDILVKARLHVQQGTITIPSYQHEQAEFFIQCLKKIPPEELKYLSNAVSIASAYVKLSIMYKRRIVSKASLYASNQAKRFLKYDQGATFVKNCVLIVYCDTLNFLFSLLNRFGYSRKSRIDRHIRLSKK